MEESFEASCTEGWPGAEFCVSSTEKSAIAVNALKDDLRRLNVRMGVADLDCELSSDGKDIERIDALED